MLGLAIEIDKWTETYCTTGGGVISICCSCWSIHLHYLPYFHFCEHQKDKFLMRDESPRFFPSMVSTHTFLLFVFIVSCLIFLPTTCQPVSVRHPRPSAVTTQSPCFLGLPCSLLLSPVTHTWHRKNQCVPGWGDVSLVTDWAPITVSTFTPLHTMFTTGSTTLHTVAVQCFTTITLAHPGPQDGSSSVMCLLVGV